jgi:uncharacterized protein (DUF1697 family)
LERSADGCAYLHVCLRKLRNAVEISGELTPAALDDFKLSLGNRPDVLVSRLEKLREQLAANPDKLEPDALRVHHKEEVIKIIEADMERLLYVEEECERQERVEERTRQSASVLPGITVLDRILRYEKGLERQLYGAMKQLERLQKGRKRANRVAANRGCVDEGRRQKGTRKTQNFGENEPNKSL